MNFNQLLYQYIVEGSYFTDKIKYTKLKDLADDNSGEEGKSEIFSFEILDLQGADIIEYELKVYFDSKKYYLDAIYFYGEKPKLSSIISFLEKKKQTIVETYLSIRTNDEGVVLFSNGGLARFNLDLETKISSIYQFEGSFSGIFAKELMKDRISAIEKVMKKIDISEVI